MDKEAKIEKVKDALSGAKLIYLAAAAGALLCLPSLFGGFFTDDWYHRLMFTGWTGLERFALDPVMHMFTFFDGDPQRTRGLMDVGFYPWWTWPDNLVAFFRPVSAITHWFDYLAWPHSPALMHLHNVLWYFAAALSVGALYRKIEGAAWIAGLMALMFALDDAHGFAVGWIANRNVLVAVTFGSIALVFHHDWRTKGGAWRAALSVLFFLMALFSKEAAVSVAGYIFAYAVFLDRKGVVSRALSLLPAGAAVILWRLTYSGLGYGASRVPTYTDPVREPFDFAVQFIERAPQLVLGQLGTPPSEIYHMFFYPPGRWKLAAAVAFLIVAGALFTFTLRRSRNAGFWATGFVLSLIPASAIFPSERALFFAGIGAFGLVAHFVASVFEDEKRGPLQILLKAFALYLLVVNVLVAALLLPLGSFTPEMYSKPVEYRQLIAGFLPEYGELSEKEIYVVNAGPSVTGVIFNWRSIHGEELPQRLMGLGGKKAGDIRITRTGQNSIRWEANGGAYGKSPWERVFRGEARPFRQGDAVELSGLIIKVQDTTADGRPSSFELVFKGQLEGGDRIWMRSENGVLMPFDLPGPGETVVVEQKLSRK